MNDLINEFLSLENIERAKSSLRFFKCNIGEYGYGDKFLGIDVPTTKKIAKKYQKIITREEIPTLIKNGYHEIRLATIFVLRNMYEKGDLNTKKKVIDIYLNNTKYINNWDLVDSSAPYLTGDYYYNYDKDLTTINKLANSNNLWEERIAILSSFYFIRNNSLALTINLATRFLNHSHDLIHKACGWMLRELGKKDEKLLKSFLNKYKLQMPRTMLRYAIEKLSFEERQEFLKKN